MTIRRLEVPPLPRLHTQLGYPVSGSTDCAVRTCQSALEFGTWGQVSPEPEVLRQAMGAQPFGGTTMAQSFRALKSFGIQPLKIGPRHRGPWATVVEWLELGHLVAVFGRYGAIVDGWRPLAGSKTYRGGHAIWCYGLEGGETLDGDPLYDGRRANIPRGATEVPIRMVRAFTEALVGEGRARAYAIPVDARLLTAVAYLGTARSEAITLAAELEECRASAPVPPPTT